jgi:hypothetical protein
VRERTGFGENRTSSITSCAGSVTLSIGIDTFPPGSWICPPGPPDWIGALGGVVSERLPPSFRARTTARTELPTSAATRP